MEMEEGSIVARLHWKRELEVPLALHPVLVRLVG